MVGGSGRLLRPALIAGALLGTNLVLAAALAASALAPRRIVVVPSARAEAELLPGAVPEATAREFALRYVLHLDNYTPATIESSTDALRKMISPRRWAGAAEALEKRTKVALEGRMSCQVLPLSARVEGLEATVEAIRRTFISDRLSREAKVRYRLSLERLPATEVCPFGLGIVGQEIEEEGDPAPAPPGRSHGP